ncbi:MAG: 3-dehydroquinate synthase [Clostridium sp.]|nr:3-dehydroquinate synthase [Clostridium sp.]
MELKIDLAQRSYPIIIQKGLINSIQNRIKKIYKGKKIFILTDKNVATYYANKLVDNLKFEGYNVKLMILEAGEPSKSFTTLPQIYNEMLDFRLTRSDIIITLGGGVVGDIGGFAASTYLRGVKFIQIPTSLLAQVDSSVGGKVAVDLARGKNLVGSFYHPIAVFIDPDMLHTLSDEFFIDGMAEVIKYGCIKDKEFFQFLNSLDSKKKLMENIEYIIYTCCNIKKLIVESDERDMGERMLLNFGHTLGHAIEQYYNYKKYTHGVAVAIGMYEITKISEKKGFTKKGSSEKIKEILIKNNLPYEIDIKIENIIGGIEVDKKNLGNDLNLILLKEIGNAKIVKSNKSYFKWRDF